ncbi:MAG TPA: hypothetical protein ENJ84_12060 [Gammaproteobacteria bacterium]|nr:hypothetical protein [Gammaproteobacteria bacterium]
MQIIQLDQFDFHPVIEASTGVVVVLVTGPHCRRCHALKQVLSNVDCGLPEWTVYEVCAEQDAAIAQEFEVLHLPAVFVFREGQFHRHLYFEIHPDRFCEALHQSLVAEAEALP